MAEADIGISDRALAVDDPRAAPTEDFLQSIRARYPVETEIDRVLTRKMRLRSGPGFKPIAMAQLVDGARALIASEIGGTFELLRPRWLTGGASKIQLAFDLDWMGPSGDHRQVTPMVLRMEPPESVVETSRLREFELIRALDGVIPVPPCYWVDAAGRFLPYPALIYGFVTGVTRPSSLPSSQVTGIGLNYGPDLRSRLGRQFLEQIGRVHRQGAEIATHLSHFDAAEIGSTAAVVRLVNWWRRVWEEDRRDDDPLAEFAYQWLIANAPPLDHVSLVHGDCRGGNFLFDETTVEITAWLDWELALLGDRHQDLAWSMHNSYRHRSEDGREELMSGFFPENQYLEEYERLSGLPVDRRRLRYFRVLVSYMSVVICGGTGYRVARGGKTHQDVVVGWLAMITHPLGEQMRQTLEELI